MGRKSSPGLFRRTGLNILPAGKGLTQNRSSKTLMQNRPCKTGHAKPVMQNPPSKTAHAKPARAKPLVQNRSCKTARAKPPCKARKKKFGIWQYANSLDGRTAEDPQTATPVMTFVRHTGLSDGKLNLTIPLLN